LGDVLIDYFDKPVAVPARLFVPQPDGMANLVYQRACFAPIVGPDLLLTADHPDRRKAQPVGVFPHEPDIIGLIGSPHQADRSNLSPLPNRVANSLWTRDIGIDDEGDHAARPAVTVRIRSRVRRLDLIESKKTKPDCSGNRPEGTSDAETWMCQVMLRQVKHSKLKDQE
jgi:hypothetical protein